MPTNAKNAPNLKPHLSLLPGDTSANLGMSDKGRFCTFISLDESDSVQCISESEYLENAERINSADEFVWQFAEDKKQAIKQHFAKFEAWEANPTLETY